MRTCMLLTFERRKDREAWLDVFQEEPLPEAHPLAASQHCNDAAYRQYHQPGKCSEDRRG